MVLSLPRAWVQSLVGEIASHKWCGIAERKKKKKKISEPRNHVTMSSSLGSFRKLIACHISIVSLF